MLGLALFSNMRAVRAVVITGASLFSRVAALVLLVLLANVLSVSDFGVAVVLIGGVIALANVFSVGVADAIASQAVLEPGRARKTVGTILAISNSLSLLAIAAAFFSEGFASLAFGSLALASSTASSMSLMNYLRGSSRPVLGSVAAYFFPPLARLAMLLILILWAKPDVSVESSYFALAMGSVLAAWISWSFVLLIPREDVPHYAPAERTRSKLPFVSAMLLVAVAWLVLGQYDVIALTWAEGPESAGTYVPTMRMFEALTALGIAYKFITTRELVDSDAGRLPFRRLFRLFLIYAVAAVLVLLLGSVVVSIFFGKDYAFLPLQGFVLAIAYWFSVLCTIYLQVLIARADYRSVSLATLLVILFSLVSMPIAASLGGSLGLSIASALAFALWWLRLSQGAEGSRRDRGH